jgi:predicted transcriptional regulator
MVPSGNDGLRIVSRCEREQSEGVTLELIAGVFRAAANSRGDAVKLIREEIQKDTEEKYGDTIKALREGATKVTKEHEELKAALGERWGSLDDLLARAKAIEATDTKHLVSKLEELEYLLTVAGNRVQEAAANLKETSHEV